MGRLVNLDNWSATICHFLLRAGYEFNAMMTYPNDTAARDCITG